MNKQEKRLLLIDLSARLPYGVKLRYVEDLVVKKESHIITLNNIYLEHIINGDADIKPYLRPMSSMTEGEKVDLEAYSKQEMDKYADNILNSADKDTIRYSQIALIYKDIDWYNKKHFDYRGLIPMGLALEAPEGMYK